MRFFTASGGDVRRLPDGHLAGGSDTCGTGPDVVLVYTRLYAGDTPPVPMGDDPVHAAAFGRRGDETPVVREISVEAAVHLAAKLSCTSHEPPPGMDVQGIPGYWTARGPWVVVVTPEYIRRLAALSAPTEVSP